MIVLDRHDALDRELYRRIVHERERVELDERALRRVDERRAAMLRALEAGAPAYGVTTGLGYMSKVAIPEADRAALQRSILLGRAIGVGEPLPAAVVRGTMLLRLTGFLGCDAAVGSGLCRFIADRLNEGWLPYVPRGPHGSAGEVIPLAHLFQTFVGEGFVLVDGERVPAAEALGVAPYEPQLKEGIALVNGAPFATALLFESVERGRALLDHAWLCAAFGVAVTGASARPFSPRIGPGERLLRWLAGGDWRDRPQAPVSTRVAPQVLGAAEETLANAERVLDRDLKAISDSPLYLPAAGDEPEGFYPSGNFHAQAAAFALDSLAVAFAQVVNLAEKRMHRLMDARFSGLAEQLSADPGRLTGGTVLHKGLVGLCGENRMLAQPASLNAPDTSAGQEDFQAFEFLAADKLERLLDNVELALAYELVALRLAQSLRTDELPPPLARVCDALADHVEPLTADRSLGPDVERVRELVRSGALLG
jgi:histidine ammonia-lyase